MEVLNHNRLGQLLPEQWHNAIKDAVRARGWRLDVEPALRSPGEADHATALLDRKSVV